MKKVIALSAALVAAGAFSASAQETAPAADPATTPPAATSTETTPPATTDTMTPAPDATTPPADTATTPETMEPATPPADTATETMPSATDSTMSPTDTATPAEGTMTVPEGFTLYAGEPLTAEKLQDAAVYASDDSSVSKISDFVLAEDGSITQVVFDVGGFLGIGARNVAVPFEELQIYTNADASEMRVYLPMTKEELEALPEYTES